MNSERKSTDLLGIAPYGDAIKIATEKTLETAQTFLYDLCRPAAAEVGLLFRDHVRVWRATNLAKIADKARTLISITDDGATLKAPPRVVHEVMEYGSWCEDEQLQQMWAGLLATSCSLEGKDESNLLFINLLKQLSSSEARLIEYACKNSIVDLSPDGILTGKPVDISFEEIQSLTEWRDKTLAQASIGHLVSLGLLKQQPSIFVGKPKLPLIQPEPLTLHLYARCCGSHTPMKAFFDKLTRKRKS